MYSYIIRILTLTRPYIESYIKTNKIKAEHYQISRSINLLNFSTFTADDWYQTIQTLNIENWKQLFIKSIDSTVKSIRTKIRIEWEAPLSKLFSNIFKCILVALTSTHACITENNSIVCPTTMLLKEL